MIHKPKHLPEDVVINMIAMWEKGMTGAEIAKELGTTRNAVMGKLHRLKLEGRVAPKKAMEPVDTVNLPNPLSAQKAPPVKPVEPKKPKPTLITLPSKTVQRGLSAKPVVQIVEKPKRGPIKFADLTRRSCKFVLNAGHPETYLFCGEVSEPGKPYCTEHVKLCFRVVHERDGADK